MYRRFHQFTILISINHDAPTLPGGLEMELTGKIASIPYLKMTLALIAEFGAKYTFEKNIIQIEEGKYKGKEFTVEADWSAASYWYQIAALAEEARITLKVVKRDHLQGDSAIVEMYHSFGVESVFNGNQVTLKNSTNHRLNTLIMISLTVLMLRKHLPQLFLD